MKIGILTFWWSQDNYGQLLQCYALQKFLYDKGHEVFLIRYNYINDLKGYSIISSLIKIFNPLKVIRLLCRILKKNKKKIINEPTRNFDLFREKYLRLTDKNYASYGDLYNEPPELDAYIVGSDQVWNYNYIDAPRSLPYRVYFFDFGDEKIKRLAYAASWGVTEITPKVRFSITPLLKKFDYIGVREQSGIKLCEKCGRDDAEWVCDPTLLIDAESYRQLYSENEIRKPTEPFMLLYMLNNTFEFDIQAVYKFAESNGVDVVYVTGNGMVDDRKKYFATIPEWLWLVDNAEYIVTNSFHCSVFSTIFHKQFGVVPLSGKQVGMNARFESLFELRGTGTRFISDKDFSVLDTKYDVKPVSVSKRFLMELN